jgi:hypothetical protein
MFKGGRERELKEIRREQKQEVLGRTNHLLSFDTTWTA